MSIDSSNCNPIQSHNNTLVPDQDTITQNKQHEADFLKKKSRTQCRPNKVINVPCSVVTRQPTLKNFRERHARALAHTITDILREYGNTGLTFLKFRDFYLKQFNEYDSIKIMKQIKVSINYWCAQRLRQDELPDKPEFRLWPHFIMKWLKHKTQIRSKGGKSKRYRLIHSIAQCKNVLEGPDRSFYKLAYEKHAATLSKEPVKTEVEILSAAYLKGQEFGKLVKKFYNPHKGYIPSRSATYSQKRSEGGKLHFLDQTCRSSNILKKNQDPCSSFRIEPTVLFLNGDAGVGKSRLVNEIVRQICLKENVPFDGSTFVRNCNTDHWDGYSGQAITILDDWAQDCSLMKDIPELIALVTENAYPLPMADLKEKGTLFTSRYIIICSNALTKKNFGAIDTMNGQRIVRELDAVYRRLHHPYTITYALSNIVTYRDDFKKGDDRSFTATSQDKHADRRSFISHIVNTLYSDSHKRASQLLMTIPEYRYDAKWRQTVYDIKDNIYLNSEPFTPVAKLDEERIYSFPSFPPTDLPKVRVCAVAKPLGTRMVTCGDAELHVLKPFQVAMHKALGTYSKFRATHGDELESILPILGELRPDQVVLSGDYESATDGMNMDLSNSLLNGILSQIDHRPTREWAIYENGHHIVEYPAWTGLKPIKQTTGQLMGSLLSFPLLCLANDLITDLAGITKQKLINGDDLLAHCTLKQVADWKTIGTKCGMKPSVGKNYSSRKFGTFNSQLVLDGHHVHYTNLKLVSRRDQIGNCAKIAQLCGISKSLMVRRSKTFLTTCPQSLDVSIQKGGLGYETVLDRDISILDKLCYFTQLLKNKKFRFSSLGLPSGYKWLAYPTWGNATTEFTSLVKEKILIEQMDLLSTKENLSEKKGNILSFKEVAKVRTRIRNNPKLRELMNEVDFHSLPNLNEVNYRIVPCRNEDIDNIFNRRMFEFISSVPCAL